MNRYPLTTLQAILDGFLCEIRVYLQLCFMQQGKPENRTKPEKQPENPLFTRIYPVFLYPARSSPTKISRQRVSQRESRKGSANFSKVESRKQSRKSEAKSKVVWKVENPPESRKGFIVGKSEVIPGQSRKGAGHSGRQSLLRNSRHRDCLV